MDRNRKISLALATLTVVFSTLAILFARVPAVSPTERHPPLVSPESLAGVAPPGTIRVSASQLIRSGGDTSVLECYTCHNKSKPPEIKFDANHHVVLPKEHSDLIISMRNCEECHAPNHPVKLDYAQDGSVIIPEAHKDLAAMAHGRNFRNENCYNCHDQNELNRLHTPEGDKLKFEQATLLCAGCHGPTYRDWEAGVGSSRVDLQACKLEYSIVSPK